jgi:propanol-preferring alcohol dehydrogenase
MLGLTIKGSSVGTNAQMDEVLSMALDGTLVPKIEVFDFAEAPAIIEKLQRYEVTGRMVVRAP